MKHTHLLLAAAVITLGVTSCRKSDIEVAPLPVEQQISVESLAKGGPNDEKKKKTLAGTLELSFNSAFTLPCTGTGLDLGTFTGPGTFQSGLATSGATAQIRSWGTPITGGTGFDVTTVCAEIIDGNGDKIFTYTYPYQVLFTAPSTTLNVDVVGGTGVYANAKGSFVGTMTMTSQSSASFSINGTIKY